MKKMIALILVCAICAGLGVLSAHAVPAPYFCGDVNWDSTVDSIDVTLIQRHLARIIELDEHSLPMADYDHDGEVSEVDVTWLQRDLSHIPTPESVGGIAEYWFTLKSFYPSFDSGKAAAGTQVTFTAEMYESEAADSTYAFYIDGELVQPRSEQNTLTYTFDSAGSYTISVKAYNRQGFFHEDHIWSYRVVEDYPYDQLSMKSVRFREQYNVFTPTLLVEAMGGTVPYTFAVSVYRGETMYGMPKTGLNDEDIANFERYVSCSGDTQWRLLYDSEGCAYLYRDFSADTEIVMDHDMLLDSGGDYLMCVQAKDADGNLSDVTQLEYCNDFIA